MAVVIQRTKNTRKRKKGKQSNILYQTAVLFVPSHLLNKKTRTSSYSESIVDRIARLRGDALATRKRLQKRIFAVIA